MHLKTYGAGNPCNPGTEFNTCDGDIGFDVIASTDTPCTWFLDASGPQTNGWANSITVNSVMGGPAADPGHTWCWVFISELDFIVDLESAGECIGTGPCAWVFTKTGDLQPPHGCTDKPCGATPESGAGCNYEDCEWDYCSTDGSNGPSYQATITNIVVS